MSNNSEFLKKYKRCLYEYVNAAGSYDVSEEGEEEMGGAPMDGDPAMGGEGPNDGMEGMGGDPAMGGDPSMGGGDPNAGMEGMGGDPAMGGDPSMGGGQGPEGFDPQGGDPNAGMEGMGGDPGMTGGETMQSDDEVIDVDDLTKSQEQAEKKIDKMNDKFEKLMGAVETLIAQNKEMERREAEAKAEFQAEFQAELEKRIPTPKQRMTMRSTKSAPYSMSPNEYMNNYAPENYSDADDNNGADDAQYQITKDDIDRFTDYNSIAKDLDIEHQGLRDILGF